VTLRVQLAEQRAVRGDEKSRSGSTTPLSPSAVPPKSSFS
jgi:hypothetical protein